MCRRNELLGSVLMACGAGLLLGLLFGSEVLQGLAGIVLLVFGCYYARRF